VGAIIGAAIAPNMGGGSKKDYWDSEGYSHTVQATSNPDPQAITAEDPSARATPSKRSDPTFSEEEQRIGLTRSRLSAQLVFWLTFPVLAVIGIVIGSISYREAPRWVVISVILLGLPAVQFVAIMVTALIIGVAARPSRTYQFRQLGKIFLGTLAGAFLGALAMGCLVGLGLLAMKN